MSTNLKKSIHDASSEWLLSETKGFSSWESLQRWWVREYGGLEERDENGIDYLSFKNGFDERAKSFTGNIMGIVNSFSDSIVDDIVSSEETEPGEKLFAIIGEADRVGKTSVLSTLPTLLKSKPNTPLAESKKIRAKLSRVAFERVNYGIDDETNQGFAEFFYPVMTHLAHERVRQLKRGSARLSAKNVKSYLSDLWEMQHTNSLAASMHQNDQTMRLIARSNHLQMENIESNWYTDFSRAFGDSMTTEVNFGDGYHETLARIRKLRDSKKRLKLKALLSIVANPTIITDEDAESHVRERMKFGVSECDARNTGTYASWLLIQSALYSISKKSDGVLDGRSKQERRDEMLEFVEGMYLFGFGSIDELSEDEVVTSVRAISRIPSLISHFVD